MIQRIKNFSFIVAIALPALPAEASTLTLVNSFGLSVQNTSITYDFLAGSTDTTLLFGGLNGSASTVLSNIAVQLNGAGQNLLTGQYTSGPNNRYAVASGSQIVFYDSRDAYFTSDFASIVGSSYRLSYNLQVGGTSTPNATQFNALRITASDAYPASATPAVPEPATWALMMLGFGGVAHAIRRKAKVSTRIRFA